MNNLKKIFTIILFFLLIIILFKYNYILNKSVIEAFLLWIKKVFPSLFIMFILNDIIIELNLLSFLKINHQIILLSLFSGTPTATFIIKEMLNKGNITLENANRLMSYTYFSNPLFLYNILSLSFNNYITFKIIIIHYLTNYIISLIFHNKYSNKINNTSKQNNLLLILPKAINKSINTLFMILGTITFYMIITNLFMKIINLNPLGEVLFKGLLEITQGLNILSKLNIQSLIKEITALAIISFGGLSIHTQVLSIISDTNINYYYFFIGRILHILISTLTYLFITIII